LRPYTDTEVVAFLNATTSDFTATILWGDNTTSTGTVAANGPGNFVVSGPLHTYTDEGTFPITVTITDKGGSVAAATTTATIADTDHLTAGTATVVINQNTFLSTVTASFSDSDTSVSAGGDLIATINWGDNTATTTGTLTDTNGTVSVAGSHAYSATGKFTVTVTLADDDTANTVSEQTTANVVGATPTLVADRAGVNVGASVTAAAPGVLANDTVPSPATRASTSRRSVTMVRRAL